MSDQMDRQTRIDEAIEACTECGGREFPKRADCDGCTASVDDDIAREADRYSAITAAISTGS